MHSTLAFKSQYLIEQIANNANYLNNIITADKAWIYCYDPVFKQQMSEQILRGSCRPLKPHTMKSKLKCMISTFRNWESLMYTYTLPDGQTVNVDWYVEVLKQLIMVHIPRKRPHYPNV